MARHTRLPLAFGLLLHSLAAPAPVAPVAARMANTCTLDYERADNMWAELGRAEGTLGVETISLPVQTSAPNTALKVFITDWRYEKQRNDGKNYYGSHLRIATNKGTMRTWLTVRRVTEEKVGLDPGERREFKHDLVDMWCQAL